MITVKNSKLNNELLEKLNLMMDLEISAKTAFRLMRIIKDLSSLVEDKIKAERRIFDKYLIKDEGGNPVPGTDEGGNPVPGSYQISDIEGFNREMGELMSVENNLDHDPIEFDDLKMDTVKISDLLKIDFLFI